MADYAFERINTVDSTNTELKRRINASFGMKTSVLIADEQTAGRGRRGRVWLNTDGALLMSICIPLKGINPDLIPLISLTAAGRLIVSHEDGNIEAIDSADVSIRWLTEERQEN